MVQRKAPQKLKLGPQDETRKRHAKLERQPSSSHHHHHQDTRTKGGGGGTTGGGCDLKKKLKLERSIRAADLESLKASSSSRPKKRSSPMTGPSPNYMKPTSSSDARRGHQPQVNQNLHAKNSTGLKVGKGFSRQSSLRAIRPLVKRSLKALVVNSATCSSTLKDSRFPEALDLNPGGTEAEGISVMRVCPYTYCSLNGHRHDPLPPLKCFISAKRKALKTQKSMKLKGVSSSLRVKGFGKDIKEMDVGGRASRRGSSCLEIAPLVEEVPDDFFVEIYSAEPKELIEREAEIEDDQVKGVDVDDQSSELSAEEEDAMMSFLEYVECDQQGDDAVKERTPSLTSEENGELSVGDHLAVALEKTDDGVEESENKDEYIAPVDACDLDEVDAEQKYEVNQASAEYDLETVGGTLEDNGAEFHGGEELCRQDVSDQSPKCQEPEPSGDNSSAFDLSEDMIFEESSESGGGSEVHHDLLKLEDDRSNVLKPDDHDDPEEQRLSESSDNLEESDQAKIEEEHIQNQPATFFLSENATEEASDFSDTESCSSNDQSDDSKIKELWESEKKHKQRKQEVRQVEGSMAKRLAKIRISRKKRTEELNKIKDFNPRAPMFLDVEPDPEAEKVDLRHQMMDERKNSEEYLIDYALQRAVSKMDPARKKKVSLLVHAFETVMPPPVYDKSMQHAMPDFIHRRIMQTCR